MMHGHEKSRFAIVAVKPANKVERSAAEPVEPRAETKRNAGQQSTCGTQGQISVSQAVIYGVWIERCTAPARARGCERAKIFDAF